MRPTCTLQIVFLIALPRSGSTLLEKILAAHPQVASIGEGWILLPLGFLDRDQGVEAVYNHSSAAGAIRELIRRLPAGRASYIHHLRRFCLALFQDLAQGKSIFLDKARYYLIIDFLAELFPDAKFIFLFRNPLDVMCSMMSTWLEDRLMLHAFYIDLFEGVRQLTRGCRVYADRGINVHYEQLVQEPAQQVRQICDFLEIPYCDDLLVEYRRVDFGTSAGDQWGIRRYDGISTASSYVWPRKLNNWYRIRFAREYLQSLGNDVLAPWNFSIEEFERTVSGMKVHLDGSLKDIAYRNLSDVWRLVSGSRLRKMLRERKSGEVYLFR